ncbi:MAG: ABC transporter permease [Gemmatimonadaceae bacterium]|nr:ABC transporter permease [Gemmatimonadaceae bacterium]NUQ94228.1 ABC transporter permease [Gemmatimonadaceae bacterium]NUR20043.1 ABC transporter permease [Gemmatimonadaceae bacterium]NUS97571.1 ABC transporter permease [Gemmatimonadaceae bacterium]
MARLWAVIKREYLERVRTKWFLISTLFAPFLLGLLTIVPIWLMSKTAAQSDIAHIAILDASGTGVGRRVRLALGGGSLAGDTSRTQLVVLDTTQLAAAESAFTHVVMKKETRGYLVLGPHVLDDTVARYAGRNGASLADVGRIQSAVRQGILQARLERAGLDAERVVSLTAAKQVELNAEQIGDKGREGGGIVKFLFSFSIAFLLYMSIVLYGQNVLRGVLEEKQTRVAEVVVSSVSTDTLLAGKVLGVGAVGITQQILWVITSIAVIHAREPIMRAMHVPSPSFSLPSISAGVLALLFVFFVLGFMLYAAIFASVGAMVNSDTEAQQAQQPFMMLLVATAILIQPVLVNPSSSLARAASIVPFSSPVIMPLRLSVSSVPWWEVGLAIGIGAVTIALFIWIASRIYRTGLLMYGKRPTLREVARWVRRSA